MRVIVFDVETPNYRNDRMSAIGVTVVEEGRVTEEFFSLVNPEARFDRFNIQLTGITPKMTETAPNFPALWEKLEPIFSSGVLCAHNAPFDLSVLGKCLRDYRIPWKQEVNYLCTVRMGRRLLPDLPNHKLNTLCDHLHIPLDHHQADSDSRACGSILCHYISQGADLNRFLRTYDLVHLWSV